MSVCFICGGTYRAGWNWPILRESRPVHLVCAMLRDERLAAADRIVEMARYVEDDPPLKEAVAAYEKAYGSSSQAVEGKP